MARAGKPDEVGGTRKKLTTFDRFKLVDLIFQSPPALVGWGRPCGFAKC